MALALGLLIVGAVVAFVVLTDKSQASPSGASSQASLSGASGSAPTAGTVVGLVQWSDLHAIGAAHGWSDAQISDWANVIKSESNGTLADTNPSSGAYGIAQFINGPSEYGTYGGTSSTVLGQLTAMANYIAQRYSNPSAAWAFHQANNWY
jgi:hypothetical protein